MAELFTWVIGLVIATVGVSYLWDAIKKAYSTDNSVTTHLKTNNISRLERFEKAGINPDDYTLDDNKESSYKVKQEPATIEAGEEETEDDSEHEEETEENDDA